MAGEQLVINGSQHTLASFGRANPNKQDFLFEYGGDEEEQPVPDVIVHVGDPSLLVATERNDLEMVRMLLRDMIL